MAQFCFDTAEAANTAKGDAKRSRVYQVTHGETTKFVVGTNQELAHARFNSEVLGVTAVPVAKTGSPGQSRGAVTKKQIDQLVDKAASASPEEAVKILGEVRTLKQQLDEARARRKASKAQPAAPTPPAVPAGNVPAPPAL